MKTTNETTLQNANLITLALTEISNGGDNEFHGDNESLLCTGSFTTQSGELKGECEGELTLIQNGSHTASSTIIGIAQWLTEISSQPSHHFSDGEKQSGEILQKIESARDSLIAIANAMEIPHKIERSYNPNKFECDS